MQHPTPSGAGSAHIARADAHDAAGRHDDAINELALGTQAGDALCTRHLGLRLLVGDRAPLLPNEGLRFLKEACERGVPEAGARAAGIVALGLRFPPDWKLALQCLAHSALHGWQPAQRQLLALCDDRALAAQAAAATQTDWAAVAAAVRLDDWRRSPAVETKSADPRVCAVPGLLRPEVCELLVALAEGRLERARVYDPISRSNIVDAHRDNTLAIFDLPSVELVHSLVQARMAAACGMPERHMEAPNVLHYAPGEQIRNHYDFVDPKSVPDYEAEVARNGQRVATFLVYLNGGYEGGTTDFPQLGLSHQGRVGEGLFFINTLPGDQPDLRTLHAGRPSSRGEKWVLTQFVRSRPTR